ncbi:MAG: hypothetical protein U5Q03_06020 [Bacteroidota bacterium]|nr:hypothetical protein [Bacteroidota bacterium]
MGDTIRLDSSLNIKRKVSIAGPEDYELVVSSDSTIFSIFSTQCNITNLSLVDASMAIQCRERMA